MTFTPLNILENYLTVYAKVYVWWLLSIGLYDCLCQYCSDGFVERIQGHCPSGRWCDYYSSVSVLADSLSDVASDSGFWAL